MNGNGSLPAVTPSHRRVAERARYRWAAAVALLLAASLVVLTEAPAEEAPAADPKPPTIRLHRPPTGSPVFEVHGLPAPVLRHLADRQRTAEQWAAVFAVYVEGKTPSKATGRPPVLGSYRVADGKLHFEPRFPLEPGLRYRAVFDPAGLPGAAGGQALTAEFTIPRPPAATTTSITQVYPTAERVPENLLKLYIHFSTAMSRGDSYRYIHVLDPAGKEIEAPFLDLPQELWDPSGMRFTLFFDPGRIKRGLRPRLDLGPIFEEGKTYTLVIDRDWLDAQGNPLKETYRRRFRALAPDDQPVDPKTWKLEPPAAGGVQALRIHFPESLDHALLNRALTVTGPQGRTVAGTVAVTDHETRWQFTPEQPWQAGDYQLAVLTTLEDLAGNQIGKQFEIDVFRQVQHEVRVDTVRVPFQVRPAR